MWKKVFIGCAWFVLAALQPVMAGWVISEKSHDKFGNQSFSTTFFQDSVIRFDKPTSVSIIRFNHQTITLIFAQHRAYWHGTVDELRKTTSRMAEEQMSKLLAYAPETQRQAIKNALTAFKSNLAKPDSLRYYPEVSVIKTHRKDTLLGYPAEEYKIVIDSVVKQEIWVTQKVRPYRDSDVQRIMAFNRALNPFAIENSLSHSPVYLHLLETGFILKSINFTTDGNRLVTEVTRLRKMPIPEAIFQVPVGYTQSTLENVMILDMKNNILNPKAIAPEDQPGDRGLPPLPPPENINPNTYKNE
jgi:hypothetical protein